MTAFDNFHPRWATYELERLALGRSSSTTVPYQYSPLKDDSSQIRLLALHPANFFEPTITVSLSRVDFTDETAVPRFEALSYAWGSAEDKVDIVIEGRHRGTLAVTRNCAEALRYLRHRKKPRRLWIDAICVNQQDLDERSRQVQRMADIYSKANQVVAWLGPESHDTGIAFDCFSFIAQRIRVDWELRVMLPLTTETGWSTPQSVTISCPLVHEQWKALTNFYSRAWFGRLWIWQEIVLASKAIIVCGVRSITWEQFEAVTFYLSLHRTYSDDASFWERSSLVDTLCLTRANFKFIRGGPFQYVTIMTQGAECTDARDKIFAILSLVDKGELDLLQIKPDYTKSVEEIYSDVMIRYISKSQCPLLLHSCLEIQNRRPDTPSWILNWEKSRLATPLICKCADIDSVAQFSVISRDVLKIVGVAVARIGRVVLLDLSSYDKTVSAGANELRRAAAMILPSMNCPDYRRTVKMLGLTLSAGQTVERYLPPDERRPDEQQLNEFMDQIVRHKGDFEHFTQLTAAGPLCLVNVRKYASGRSLFQTEDGRFGLGPRAVQDGDIVSVLLGCDSPMILRQKLRGRLQSSQYEIVGETYCHGIMDGEALLGPLPNAYRCVFIEDKPAAFLDRATGVIQLEDPRLGELPKGWEKRPNENGGTWYFNKGEKIKTLDDPRKSSTELRRRGVRLEEFHLV